MKCFVGDIKVRTSTFSKSSNCFRVRQGSGRRKERKGNEAKSLPQGLKKQVIGKKRKELLFAEHYVLTLYKKSALYSEI